MAETNNKKQAEDGTPPLSEFPLLKDDYVPGVGEKKTEPAVDAGPATALMAVASEPRRSIFAELPESPILVPRRSLQITSRRDFLAYGLGVAAVGAGFWWLLPDDTRARVFGARGGRRFDMLDRSVGLNAVDKSKFLDGVLSFDDDVATALYSPTRSVPTYDKSLADPNLRNNYDGATPDPGYIADWTMTLDGLASGKSVTLSLVDLLANYRRHEQVTRLCCVEGWSTIAWWAGLRFADLLRAYPPAPEMQWAKIDSSVNLDSDGNSDPYYVSIDLPTALHPQTLLATHYHGKPLDVGHGAPVRLIAPMKLGLKNIKAITAITYTVQEPADYWNERGYSKYDGI